MENWQSIDAWMRALEGEGEKRVDNGCGPVRVPWAMGDRSWHHPTWGEVVEEVDR